MPWKKHRGFCRARFYHESEPEKFVTNVLTFYRATFRGKSDFYDIIFNKCTTLVYLIFLNDFMYKNAGSES